MLASLVATAAVAIPFLPAQNQALQLTTGTDGGVEYQFDARMVPPTGITVEAWITYDDSTVPTGQGYYPTIARQNIAPSTESWNFRVSAATTGARNLQLIIRTNNGFFAATYNFAPGEFLAPTHVAGTFDGTTIRVFKNGLQVAQGAVPVLSEVLNNGGLMRIGNGDPVAPGNETWNGTIDEVRIWPMARSAGEITATLNQELLGLPGGVLTFPLNGSYDSSDLTVVGTAFGTSAFVAGTTLPPAAAVLVPLAQPSSNCARKPQILVGSLPQIGNPAFAFWCVRGPRPATSPAGVVFAADSPAPVGQPPVLGLDLAFDLATIAASAVLAPPTNALGNATFPLPIPNQPSLVGLGWVFQFGFLDAQCGPQGITTSDGLQFVIQ